MWDKSLPEATTKLRLDPAIIRANWDAIENGGVPHTWLQLAQQVLDPALIAATGQLYSKASGARTECFYEKDNGATAQLTGLPITTVPVAAGFHWGITTPWGLIINWGRLQLVGGNLTIAWAVPYNAFHTCVTAKGFNADTININWQGESNAGISFAGDGTHTFGFVAIGV